MLGKQVSHAGYHIAEDNAPKDAVLVKHGCKPCANHASAAFKLAMQHGTLMLLRTVTLGDAVNSVH